jgi:hypothetical protein
MSYKPLVSQLFKTCGSVWREQRLFAFEGHPFMISWSGPAEDDRYQMQLDDICACLGIEDIEATDRALGEIPHFGCFGEVFPARDGVPGLVNLWRVGQDSPLGVIRSFAKDGFRAVRFTEWVIANVISAYPAKLAYFNQTQRADWLRERKRLLASQEPPDDAKAANVIEMIRLQPNQGEPDC